MADADVVTGAIEGCDAVVHAAAVVGNRPELGGRHRGQQLRGRSERAGHRRGRRVRPDRARVQRGGPVPVPDRPGDRRPSGGGVPGCPTPGPRPSQRAPGPATPGLGARRGHHLPRRGGRSRATTASRPSSSRCKLWLTKPFMRSSGYTVNLIDVRDIAAAISRVDADRPGPQALRDVRPPPHRRRVAVGAVRRHRPGPQVGGHAQGGDVLRMGASSATWPGGSAAT